MIIVHRKYFQEIVICIIRIVLVIDWCPFFFYILLMKLFMFVFERFLKTLA